MTTATWTDSADGKYIVIPADHSGDVLAYATEKYPALDPRTVPCTAPGCSSMTTTARPPWADITATCSRACSEERQNTVRACACSRTAMRVNAPHRLPPVCTQQCADLRKRWFGE